MKNLFKNVTFSARYEVLRNNAVFATIYDVDNSVEIASTSSSALKMTIRGNFKDYSTDIDFLTDRLRPVLTVNGTDYPCGMFVITTETRTRSDNVKSVSLEGYSLLYLAERKKIETPLYIAAGSNYITEIVNLLATCGISDIEPDSTTYTFATDRQDWEVGTSVLDIVNQLLSEISYNSAWMDLSGKVRLTKYEQSSITNVNHVYSAGQYSLIEDYYEVTQDRFAKCNVFRAVCENPEFDEPMVATSENDIETSPYAISKMGRILYTETVSNIPSQAALQAYVDKLKYQSLQTTETVTFKTAIVPEHEAYETVALELGDMVGLYTEAEWRIPVSAGGTMEHKARRIIT